MELPTPKNADSPKQKKHREQAIVIGTLVLVILTFVLVVRRGSNAAVTSDGSDFIPQSGGGTAGDNLPAMIGGIPGQVASLEQGNINTLRARNKKQTARLNKQSDRIKKQAERIKRLRKRENKLDNRLDLLQHPNAHGHPKHPHHQIHVTHHTKQPHPQEHWTSRPTHPPTHHGKKHQSHTVVHKR